MYLGLDDSLSALTDNSRRPRSSTRDTLFPSISSGTTRWKLVLLLSLEKNTSRLYWSDINTKIIKSLASLEEKEDYVDQGLGMH